MISNNLNYFLLNFTISFFKQQIMQYTPILTKLVAEWKGDILMSVPIFANVIMSILLSIMVVLLFIKRNYDIL